MVASSAGAQSQESPISRERLSRATEVLTKGIASRTIGSAVGLIACEGRIVFLEAVGEASPGVAMSTDAIVRLASITKPITAVAILLLNEQGKLQLSDPVEKYLPAFRGFASTPITIHDLLTHQAGLAASGPELDNAWEHAKTAGEFTAILAKTQPRFARGTAFEYGPAYEVLAAVVEAVTRQTYEEFLIREVLGPLRMEDTFFFVPDEKRSRLAAQYQRNESGELVVVRARGQEEQRANFFSGGGGLRSTVGDYYRFAQFLLNGGELDGVRLLSPSSIKLMTTSHTAARYPEENYGWGLGVQVRTTAAGTELGQVGSFGWNGGTGTLFVVDPQERLVLIIFAPMTPRSPGVWDLRRAFVTAAYQSVNGVTARESRTTVR